MVADAGRPRRAHRARAGGGLVPEPPARVVVLWTRAAGGADRAAATPAGARPEPRRSLAYVIYTSGLDGQAQGRRRSRTGRCVNLLASMAAEPGLGAEDRLLAVTSLSFDIAGWSCFCRSWWAPGSCSRAARPRSTAPSSAALIAGRRAITVDAGHARRPGACSSSAGWRGPPALRGSSVGGEACRATSPSSCSRGRGRGLEHVRPDRDHDLVDRPARHARAPSPVLIGRPIANTRVYVLDPAGGPRRSACPASSTSAARASRAATSDRPDLTAERFVAGPLRERDRAGRAPLPHGRSRALARGRRRSSSSAGSTAQVKIRGFRVELGEIEAALAAAPGRGAGRRRPRDGVGE